MSEKTIEQRVAEILNERLTVEELSEFNSHLMIAGANCVLVGAVFSLVVVCIIEFLKQ